MIDLSNRWHVNAEIACVEDKRIIIYNMEEAQKYANPNLGDALCLLTEPCERLLESLEKQKADQKDIAYVKNEINFLKQIEAKWRTVHKNWWI
jgi:hypothetical protein